MKLPAIQSVVVLTMTVAATAPFAADQKHGQALYESRCLECHAKTPIGPGGPKAVTLDGVLLQVKLWDSLAGGLAWSSQDAEDVAAYLNDKFYHHQGTQR